MSHPRRSEAATHQASHPRRPEAAWSETQASHPRCSYVYRTGDYCGEYCAKATKGLSYCMGHASFPYCDDVDGAKAHRTVPTPTHTLYLTVDATWLAVYGSLELEVDQPILEALGAYFRWIETALDTFVEQGRSVRTSGDAALHTLIHRIIVGIPPMPNPVGHCK